MYARVERIAEALPFNPATDMGAYPDLPEAIRTGIVAMVRAATGTIASQMSFGPARSGDPRALES